MCYKAIWNTCGLCKTTELVGSVVLRFRCERCEDMFSVCYSVGSRVEAYSPTASVT